MAPPTPPTGLTVSLAAALTFMPFGISMLALMLGGAAFFSGCCARTGMNWIRKLDGTENLNWRFFARSFASLLCCIPLAAVASCIVFIGAHLANIEADAGCGGVLFIAGLRGPEGFQWLTDTFTTVITKVIPGAKPGGDGP